MDQEELLPAVEMGQVCNVEPPASCVCCGPTTPPAVYTRRSYKAAAPRPKTVQTHDGALHDMTVEAAVGDEQAARRQTVGILARFFELRHELQRQQELGVSTTKRTVQFALAAGAIMMERKQYYDFKEVGEVPGVRVGDWYSYMFELVLIGLHRHLRGSISYISATTALARRKYDVRSVTCSIIASEDDATDGERLIFTGQGPKNRHQRAETGNLALLNSCHMKLPVRVIQRHKVRGSVTGRIYTYNGLYTVEGYVQAAAAHGFNVFKFFLRRDCGQPELQPDVRKVNSCPDTLLDLGLLTPDISQGTERTPVRVVNTVDVDSPPPFRYTATVWCPDEAPEFHSRALSCDCGFGCCGAGSCACAEKNHGGVRAYNGNGRLIRVLDIVYECGRRCGCGDVCRNRVSQMGLRHRLEVFKTPEATAKGWGVRTLEFIPSGSFVCELTGELITASAASERENDEYLFDLDFQKGAKVRGEEPPSKLGSSSAAAAAACRLLGGDASVSAAEYVIDAREYGNVARFINHSCDPNLFVQGVLYDHDDVKRGHIMLFASDDIAAFTELSYDYGYELDSVRDVQGNVKVKVCHCGAPACRKRLY